MEKGRSFRLTESAIMLAFATILSVIPIAKLPFGGSITACSMLPIILIAYRHGTKWGLFTAFAFSLLQLLLGLNNLSYATSVQAAIAIIMLDYIIAFTVLGFAGAFRRIIKSQTSALAVGTIVVCVLRFICHNITGFTVWRDVSVPINGAIIYSLIYNATYMIPETLITVVGAVYISRVLDFRNESITRTLPKTKAPDLVILFSGLWKAFFAAAFIYDVRSIFQAIQNADDGTFDITKISEVNWIIFAIVSAAGIAAAILFAILANKVSVNDSTNLSGLFTALPFVGVAAAAVADIVFIVFTFLSGPVTAVNWVQMILATVAAVFAYIFVKKRHKAKRQPIYA